MNKEARKENKLTLQNLLGKNEENSEKIINSPILINVDKKFVNLENDLNLILSKTFENVHSTFEGNVDYSCEIVTDYKSRVTNGPFVIIGRNQNGKITISSSNYLSKLDYLEHDFFAFLGSCYISAMVLKNVASSLPINVANSIILDVEKILPDNIDNINIGKAYLAGAGAIGNSFLYGLKYFNISGELSISDPDYVSGSNLNRCLFFDEEDAKKNKAEILAEKAQHHFKNLNLIGLDNRLQDIPDKSDGPWLKKLIVAVDSRRARRSLQYEIPFEVFDASTTGVEEIVVHYHKRPLNENACMGCVYVKENQENAHEKHIAETFGVSLDKVKMQFIDKKTAEEIGQKFSISSNEIEGLPYDTLFKQLCGEGNLMTSETKQVLAPLAFVSALAGAFLTLLIVDKHQQQKDSFNYWRLSPWSNMNFKLKQTLPTNLECEFCNDKSYSSIANEIWNSSF